MDIISIKGITCESIIGVWEWERHVRQKLVVDLELGVDFSAAAASDQLSDTVDYQKITQRVIEICEASNYQLLEALISQIADTVWDEYTLHWLRVAVDKGGVLKQAKSVALSTERGKRH